MTNDKPPSAEGLIAQVYECSPHDIAKALAKFEAYVLWQSARIAELERLLRAIGQVLELDERDATSKEFARRTRAALGGQEE